MINFFPLAQPQKTSTIIRIFTRHERGFTTWRKSCFSHFFLNTRFICAWSNIMLMCVSTHSFSEKKNLFKGLACIIHKSLHCKMFKLEVLHSWCKARNFFKQHTQNVNLNFRPDSSLYYDLLFLTDEKWHLVRNKNVFNWPHNEVRRMGFFVSWRFLYIRREGYAIIRLESFGTTPLIVRILDVVVAKRRRRTWLYNFRAYMTMTSYTNIAIPAPSHELFFQHTAAVDEKICLLF